MKMLNVLSNSLLAVSLLATPAAFSSEHMKKMPMEKGMTMGKFMEACDMDRDGMMSKSEMMAHMEKMFDKMDTKKTGKLDKSQTAAFLKELTAPSGG